MAIGEFYELVPKGFKENLEYRIKLRELCATDERARKVVWEACRDDFLFWLCAFAFLVEPRIRLDSEGNELPKMIPFIPWEHQVPAIKEIVKNLGKRDIVVFKSRGEGFSWIAVLLALHDFLFEDLALIGLVSNKKEKADKYGSVGSLMGKIDWELTKLPDWMIGTKDVDWRRSISEACFTNLRTGAQINAFAATDDAGRAERYKWFLADEIAFWDTGKDRRFMEAVRESTECRLCISTPCGSEGVFYDMVHVPSNTAKIRVHWTQNPYKNRGLYKLIEGIPAPVDGKTNPIPPDYIGPQQDVLDLYSRLRSKGFRLEGSLRSPWYDQQCDRSDATPQSIAQELDLDFGGSMYRVFSVEFMDKVRETLRRPAAQGCLHYHPETLAVDFTTHDGFGECKLWTPLDARGRPPMSTYVVAADISSGLGGSFTSNSVCEVVDRVTGEQVMEYVTNTIEPGEFAELCIGIAKWFYDAYLGWEINGPGAGFTKRALQLGYSNLYMRTVHYKRAGKKKGKEVGWYTDPKSREMLFSDFHRKGRNGEVVIHSEGLLHECGEYIRQGTNSPIVHVLASSTTDESSRGQAHGDRVIAFGLAVQLLLDRPILSKRADDQVHVGPPPVNTLAWRVQQWERMDHPQDEWDDMTLGDVTRLAGGGFLD